MSGQRDASSIHADPRIGYNPRMKIRALDPGDSAALAMIFHRAVHEVGIKYYSQAQVDAWSPSPAPADAFIARAADGRSVFVAVSADDEPLGFIELEKDGHIDRFYCRPDVVGTGIGSALYDRLERTARDLGIARLYVEASEAARGLFVGKGFQIIRRRDFVFNSVQIHNYLMEKALH